MGFDLPLGNTKAIEFVLRKKVESVNSGQLNSGDGFRATDPWVSHHYFTIHLDAYIATIGSDQVIRNRSTGGRSLANHIFIPKVLARVTRDIGINKAATALVAYYKKRRMSDFDFCIFIQSLE